MPFPLEHSLICKSAYQYVSSLGFLCAPFLDDLGCKVCCETNFVSFCVEFVKNNAR